LYGRRYNGSIGAITNTGTIIGYGTGLDNGGSIGTITNNGLIYGCARLF